MTSLREEKFVRLLGLLIECPLEKPLDDCPAKQYRGLSLDEKYKLTRSMKEEDIDNIIYHHQECLRLRELELFGQA